MKRKRIFIYTSFLFLSVSLLENSYAENITVGNDVYYVKWIAEDNFTNTDWKKRWHPEPEDLGAVSKGKLIVNGTGTIWFQQELPKNLFTRYSARAFSGMSNFNNFFSAREPDGLIVKLGKRKGIYSSYFDMNLYAITYTPGWTRLWRGPDRGKYTDDQNKYKKAEYLDGKNGFQASRIDKPYIFVITVLNGRIRYYIDGKKWLDWQDPQPHDPGKFAIRTWKTNAIWYDFVFGEILPNE